MKTKIFTGLIILYLFTGFKLSARNNTEGFETISTGKGLSSSVVTCILKDSKGFMWFGTQNGLNKFDGYNITAYIHSDSSVHSVSGNYIRSLFEDKEGSIWIGTEHHGLNRFDRSTHRFEPFLPDTSKTGNYVDNTVNAITQLKNGNLLIGTNKGLFQVNIISKSFEKLKLSTDNSMEGFTTQVFLTEPDGTVWIGTDKGLIRLNPGSGESEIYIHDHSNENTLGNNTIHAIYRSEEGILYIGTNEGLQILNEAEGSFTRFDYESNFEENTGIEEIHGLAEDHRGNLWIGTFGGGLVRVNPKHKNAILYKNISGDSQSLSNDYIFTLLFDITGVLWVGTYGGGINKLEMVNIWFDQIKRDAGSGLGLASNDVYSLLSTIGQIWIGTDNGLSIYNQQDQSISNIQKIPDDQTGLSDNSIYALLEDSEKNIWIGTAAGGLNKLNASDRKTGNFKFTKFLENEEILCLFEDQSNTIWAGTRHGIKLIKNNSVVGSFKRNSENGTGLSDNEIFAIRQDKNGVVWIGTNNGLNRYNHNESTFTTIDNGLLKNDAGTLLTIYCIFEDSDGWLWLGTDNSGLIKMNREKTGIEEIYTTEKGLPDNVIYGILEDEKNCLWLSSNNGIIKAIKHENSNSLSFVHFSSNNYLPVDAFNIGAFCQGVDGVLYFGSYEGVTYFNPENVMGNKVRPPVYITKFQLFFKDVPVANDGSSPLSKDISETQTIILNHDQNVLSFEFTALNYIQPVKNSFAFMMEGLNDSWNYVGSQRSAQYLYIPPGEYTFKVKASNNDGLWNEEGASLQIIIKPPFTQTVWFYLIVIVLLIAIIYWILNVRTRRLKVIRARLEKQVQTRTSELREKNEALNMALEDLKKTQSQLIDSEKMASLGQLTAGVAHEINNPINFVSGNVKPLKQDINDIVSVLNKYEELIEKYQLADRFNEVEKLKMEVEYHFVLEEINKLLEGIGEGAARTSEIVKGLRNFSRMDEHELKLADVNQGLESTLLILHNKLKRRIEVVKDYGKIPEIMCYPGQLNQVFLNIINNGLQAIEGEGKIFIKTWKDKEGVKISIRDTGCGMPESVKKRIFEPFFTTKDVGKGTGLGLSISFGIIEKHSGTIEVITEKNQGSEFIITLPVNQI
ncbi:MAG: hypothetical protein JW731_04100 [Bacteroidales bacterium]|nr:hypothetical protein [Bacteroidales bacterium]